MGISELRQGGFDRQRQSTRVPMHPLGRDLVRQGVISGADATLAELVQRRCDTSLDRILMAEGLAREDDLLTAHARRINAEARNVPEVIEIQTFLGRVDLRLSVIARDMAHYQQIYRSAILTLPHIADIEALMHVARIKSDEGLPL